jgi:hypothetical protein
MEKTKKILTDNLLALANLETEFQSTFDDKDLYNQIGLMKASLAFFLDQKEYNRAIYESEQIAMFLVDLLSD